MANSGQAKTHVDFIKKVCYYQIPMTKIITTILLFTSFLTLLPTQQISAATSNYSLRTDKKTNRKNPKINRFNQPLIMATTSVPAGMIRCNGKIIKATFCTNSAPRPQQGGSSRRTIAM